MRPLSTPRRTDQATRNSQIHTTITLKAFGYAHGSVDHAKGKYVVGAIHTNTIEGFWSIFKRGVMGTFHKVSSKYLPLYVAEFEFWYNNRENQDIFGAAISQC